MWGVWGDGYGVMGSPRGVSGVMGSPRGIYGVVMLWGVCGVMEVTKGNLKDHWVVGCLWGGGYGVMGVTKGCLWGHGVTKGFQLCGGRHVVGCLG